LNVSSFFGCFPRSCQSKKKIVAHLNQLRAQVGRKVCLSRTPKRLHRISETISSSPTMASIMLPSSSSSPHQFWALAVAGLDAKFTQGLVVRCRVFLARFPLEPDLVWRLHLTLLPLLSRWKAGNSVGPRPPGVRTFAGLFPFPIEPCFTHSFLNLFVTLSRRQIFALVYPGRYLIADTRGFFTALSRSPSLRRNRTLRIILRALQCLLSPGGFPLHRLLIFRSRRRHPRPCRRLPKRLLASGKFNEPSRVRTFVLE